MNRNTRFTPSVAQLKGVGLAFVLLLPVAFAVPPGTDAEIEARLQAHGSLCREGEDCGAAQAVVASGPLSGEEVYNQFCFVCHAAGVGGAPILGDGEQWAPRVATGMESLMNSTLNGKNGMPARGTCVSCSDDELQAAVDFMLEGV